MLRLILVSVMFTRVLHAEATVTAAPLYSECEEQVSVQEESPPPVQIMPQAEAVRSDHPPKVCIKKKTLLKTKFQNSKRLKRKCKKARASPRV